MSNRPEMVLEGRAAADWVASIVARRPAYTPEWIAPDKSAAGGLTAIAARYLEAIAQRLNQAPDKNKIAFLDLAGLGLVPAQAARAVVVFTLAPGASGGSAPQATPLGAPAGGRQLTFETERATGVSGRQLLELVSLWPGRDEYIDHSDALRAGLPLHPFASSERRPTPHHLYLSHSVLLALAGSVEISVEFELTHKAAVPLPLVWEYWDGKVWQGFHSTNPECGKTSQNLDSTNGLSESGSYVLRADRAQAARTTVDGQDDFWLRARLVGALVPETTEALPIVDGIRLASTVNQALRGRLRVAEPRARTVAGGGAGAFALYASAPPAMAGGRVTNEAGNPIVGALVHLIDPASPARPAFTSAPSASDGSYLLQNVTFDRPYLYRVVFAGLEFSGRPEEVRPKEAASSARPDVDLTLSVEGLSPDKAYADGVTLDVSKPFSPLGAQPQPGSAFYLTSDEAFAKPGAKVRIYFARTRSPQDETTVTGGVPLSRLLIWEYWNGRHWSPLPVSSTVAGSTLDLNQDDVIDFTVPLDMESVGVNGEIKRWVRARLQSGSYGFKQEVVFKTNGGDSHFAYIQPQPPVLAACRLGYTWQHGPFHPERVLSYNDFQYRDRTHAAVWPGTSFAPFERTADVTPALYLGFDAAAPTGEFGVFFDVEEAKNQPPGPALVWEYWSGLEWRRLPSEDETGNLSRPGIVRFLSEPDDAQLNRFGQARHWLRGRLKEDGPPNEPSVAAIFPNAVWACERRTLRDLPIGESNGTPTQAFVVLQTPILPGEVLELRELAGARANVEWRILARELFAGDAELVALEQRLAEEGPPGDLVHGALRLVRNRKKQIIEAWVRWQGHPHLFFSTGTDRHYALDRATGRLSFGDGENGRVPPAGSAILMREMSSGGGSHGNVRARAIAQLLGVVPGVQAVFNPRAAEGGADGETAALALQRGPRTLRHRGRALSAADYETLAREASPAVAIARAIAGRNSAGVPAAGWVTLLVVPHSEERRPYPSFDLRRRVREYLEQRAPADLAGLGRIHVTGPAYATVDVAVTLAARVASQSGPVEAAARATLERFLHPLIGGPGGEGWELGRDVFLSDLAAELERTDGVDYVTELSMLRGGIAQGQTFAIADDEIVAAGTITIRLEEAGA